MESTGALAEPGAGVGHRHRRLLEFRPSINRVRRADIADSRRDVV